MMFHLGDSYFFINELLKTQATTREENDLFNDIIQVRTEIIIDYIGK